MTEPFKPATDAATPPATLPDDLIAEADSLIADLSAHADPSVGEKLDALLGRIDAVHRAALTHLVEGIRAMAGDAFLNRLTSDPAVRLLLMSYDLVAVDRRLQAEEALDAVRGHLHAHGLDVELLEVVGGVVYVRLHGPVAGPGLDGVKRDLEAALREGLPGFQQLELGERNAWHAPGAAIPVGALRRARRPVYRDAFPAIELPAGGMRALEIGGRAILVANVDGVFHAVTDACAGTPLPLRFGSLAGAELRCSWHGCRYDVRSGARLDAEGDRLAVLPVAVEGGMVRVAVATEPAGDLS